MIICVLFCFIVTFPLFSWIISFPIYHSVDLSTYIWQAYKMLFYMNPYKSEVLISLSWPIFCLVIQPICPPLQLGHFMPHQHSWIILIPSNARRKFCSNIYFSRKEPPLCRTDYLAIDSLETSILAASSQESIIICLYLVIIISTCKYICYVYHTCH